MRKKSGSNSPEELVTAMLVSGANVIIPTPLPLLLNMQKEPIQKNMDGRLASSSGRRTLAIALMRLHLLLCYERDLSYKTYKC